MKTLARAKLVRLSRLLRLKMGLLMVRAKCKKGHPCGKVCIPMTKKCKKGGGDSAPTAHTLHDLQSAGITIDNAEALKLYNTHIRMSPAEFRGTLTHGMGFNGAIQLSMSDPTMKGLIELSDNEHKNATLMTPGPKLEITMRGTFGDTIYGSTVMRHIDFDTKTVNHTLFSVPENEQSTGLSRKLTANFIKVYDKAGIEKVALHANLDVGGYTWARYGFVPTKESWESIRPNIIQKVTALHGDGEISTRTKLSVIKAAMKDDVKSIFDIADKKVLTRTRTLPTTKPDDPPKRSKVSQELLLGENWYGVVSLKGHASRRIRSYIKANK